MYDPFKINFYVWYKTRIKVHFFPYIHIQSFQYHFLEDFLFLLYNFGASVKNQMIGKMCVYSELSLLFHESIWGYLGKYYIVLITRALKEVLEPGYRSPTLFFFPQDFFGYSSFVFPF